MTEQLAPLGLLLTGYVVAATLVATLAPFRFAWPDTFALDLGLRHRDVLLNLLLLFPLGFLYRLGAPRRRTCLDAFVLGAGLSLAIESVQLFLPSRCASPIDLITNATGAWAGAHAHRLLGPVSDRRLVGRLRRHLPISHLLALAVPALWLDALAADRVERMLPSLPLGLFGAVIAVAVWHNGSRERAPRMRRLLLSVAGWFALGIAPAFPRHPLASAMLVAAVASSAGILARTGVLAVAADRRFEVPTLRRSGVLLLAYLACLAIQGAGTGTGGAFRLGFPTLGGDGLDLMLAILESLAAFALVGYALAELGSRSGRSRAQEIVRIALWVLPLALAAELLRGLMWPGAGSAVVVGLALMAAFWGAALYRAQREVARQRRVRLAVGVPPPPGLAAA